MIISILSHYLILKNKYYSHVHSFSFLYLILKNKYYSHLYLLINTNILYEDQEKFKEKLYIFFVNH